MSGLYGKDGALVGSVMLSCVLGWMPVQAALNSIEQTALC
jgi:hypothetical protein